MLCVVFFLVSFCVVVSFVFVFFFFFFFSSRRRHTRCLSDWSSDVCSSDLVLCAHAVAVLALHVHEVGCEAGGLESTRLAVSHHVTRDAFGSGVLQIGRASCRERV